MRLTLVLTVLLTAVLATAQVGPADRLWNLYKQGRFEDVVREGKVELTTGTSTAQVNLAVGRSLVDLGKNEEGLVYLETAVRMDPQRTWVYAWAQNYLGTANFQLGRTEAARAAWILARDCAATRNATAEADANLKFRGVDSYFDTWESFSSEHFAFRFSPNLGGDFDGAAFARRHENAYAVISAWFGGGPANPISFFVWAGNKEAATAGMPPLGFARAGMNVVHARSNQTVGHEMTHVISAHALEPVAVVGLINEGISVYHDQTGRDQLARAHQALAAREEQAVLVSVAALWDDWGLLTEEFSYPIAGAWVKVLIDQGGKEKFLEFFRNQELANARKVYGPDLQVWMDEFDAMLYR